MIFKIHINLFDALGLSLNKIYICKSIKMLNFLEINIK